jgi:hypothetical protein
VFRPTLAIVQPGATRVGYTGTGQPLRSEEHCMPAGQSSWVRRSLGLALSRHLLRRSLARQGDQGSAVLATVIARPAPGGAGPFQRWAAKLSHPSVELWVQDDHVVIEEDGELLASGALSR